MPPPRAGGLPVRGPFTFGKPLVLNSQPPTFFGSSLAPPPDASASDAPMGGGCDAVAVRACKVGGCVTAPAKHGLKDTFTRTTGRAAPIPGDDRDRPARRVAPTKIGPRRLGTRRGGERGSVGDPPYVDDVPASAAATNREG